MIFAVMVSLFAFYMLLTNTSVSSNLVVIGNIKSLLRTVFYLVIKKMNAVNVAKMKIAHGI